MKFVKQFLPFEVVPWYYGYVRYDILRQTYVMAIVPCHILLRACTLWKLAWHYFQQYGHREDRFNEDQRLQRAWEDGRREGLDEGRLHADLQYRPIVLELQDTKRKLLDMERTLKALQTISHVIK